MVSLQIPRASLEKYLWGVPDAISISDDECNKKDLHFPLQWSQIFIQNVKKKNGPLNKLESCRSIFLVSIFRLIFEKLLKNRIQPIMERNMSKFQTGGVKGKGDVDNLFVLRGLIDHSYYLAKELWITFYDTEKCFDSLWLEVCINTLWRLKWNTR